MDGVQVYRWFLTASPFELRIVYFNSQLIDFTSQTAMRSRINYALMCIYMYIHVYITRSIWDARGDCSLCPSYAPEITYTCTCTCSSGLTWLRVSDHVTLCQHTSTCILHTHMCTHIHTCTPCLLLSSLIASPLN